MDKLWSLPKVFSLMTSLIIPSAPLAKRGIEAAVSGLVFATEDVRYR
jgi:hypothetical protein